MKLLKCPNCKEYTLKDSCSKCKVKTFEVKVAKFSLEDKYGKYRRMLKEEKCLMW